MVEAVYYAAALINAKEKEKTMSRNLSKEELITHKNIALNRLDEYMTNLIEDSNSKIRSKADKLSYWLEDWSTFLAFEPEFSPKSLRRYKRGEIIKAHLGYNVGSEEGGLHYCVVIDKENSRNSPVVTIVPLTSVKEKGERGFLHTDPIGRVYLPLDGRRGSEITGISTSSTKLKKIFTFCLRLPLDLSGA